MSKPIVIETCEVCGLLASMAVREIMEFQPILGGDFTRWGKQHRFCPDHAEEFENRLRVQEARMVKSK